MGSRSFAKATCCACDSQRTSMIHARVYIGSGGREIIFSITNVSLQRSLCDNSDGFSYGVNQDDNQEGSDNCCHPFVSNAYVIVITNDSERLHRVWKN